MVRGQTWNTAIGFFYLYFFVDSSQQHVCGFIEVNFKAKALHPALPFPSPQLLLDTSLELWTFKTSYQSLEEEARIRNGNYEVLTTSFMPLIPTALWKPHAFFNKPSICQVLCHSLHIESLQCLLYWENLSFSSSFKNTLFICFLSPLFGHATSVLLKWHPTSIFYSHCVFLCANFKHSAMGKPVCSADWWLGL